ncbi:hypothetical protein RN001_015624 [Aquatica leii]|uniref:Uncharacterized protein n=1 Tax=Aquatica leii TaxID=1421715 RepID=A0AAN7SMQ6_9COLE|nr:hypothetical protein RN001_015624 [Aquatica leii]
MHKNTYIIKLRAYSKQKSGNILTLITHTQDRHKIKEKSGSADVEKRGCNFISCIKTNLIKSSVRHKVKLGKSHITINI